MMLTEEQLEFLLEQLSWETVVEPSDKFQFRVQQQVMGYREGVAGKVQATLSMLLEGARKLNENR